MRNILKIQAINKFCILFCFFSAAVPGYAVENFECILNKAEKHDVRDCISSPLSGSIELKYSKRQRKIWLESKKLSESALVHKLEKNAGPELVGEEKSIRFVTKPKVIDGHVFFGITFAERSMRGDGGGQCGAGSEEYFVAYKISDDNRFVEIFRMLISSCIEGIYLDTGDGSEADQSISTDDGRVTIKWLTYRDNGGSRIGTYDFHRNTLEF